MPASQAASLTPGTAGMSGSRAGANGEIFAAALAIAILPCRNAARDRMPPIAYCFGCAPGARSPSTFLISGSTYSIWALLRRSVATCCAFWWIMAAADPVLDGLEGGRRRAARRSSTLMMCQPNWVSNGSLDLALLQLEGRLLELRHHLAAREEAELAALVLGAGVLGILLGQLREVGAVRDLLEQLARLVLAVDQDVAGAHLLLGLQRRRSAVVEFLGVGIADRCPCTVLSK